MDALALYSRAATVFVFWSVFGRFAPFSRHHPCDGVTSFGSLHARLSHTQPHALGGRFRPIESCPMNANAPAYRGKLLHFAVIARSERFSECGSMSLVR